MRKMSLFCRWSAKIYSVVLIINIDIQNNPLQLGVDYLTKLNFIVLNFIVLNFIVFYFIVLYFIVLYFIVLYFIVLFPWCQMNIFTVQLLLY